MTDLEQKSKEKAEKLIEKFSKYVSGFVGSSFLTGTEFPETIRFNAAKIALKYSIEMSNEWDDYNTLVPDEFTSNNRTFWFYVAAELTEIVNKKI